MELKNNNFMNKEKWSKYFLISIAGGIVLAFLYGGIITGPKFRERGRYTIGVFNKFRATKGGGYHVFYTYSVNGKSFRERSSASSRDFNDNDIGKRFLVKYVEREEDLSKLLLQYPVPDSIKSAPPNGWKELPKWAKER